MTTRGRPGKNGFETVCVVLVLIAAFWVYRHYPNLFHREKAPEPYTPIPSRVPDLLGGLGGRDPSLPSVQPPVGPGTLNGQVPAEPAHPAPLPAPDAGAAPAGPDPDESWTPLEPAPEAAPAPR